jgi:hypothetical protein
MTHSTEGTMIKKVAPTVREIQQIENFFKEIAYKVDGYPEVDPDRETAGAVF